MPDLELLRERARIIREIRAFFDSRQYLSVDTPLLSPDLIPENCLEVFETSWLPPDNSKQKPEKRWLVPSPEIWMKKLIARHRENIYQISKCFRNTESKGHLHSPEFAMLEYYTMNADYMDSITLTEELFVHLSGIDNSYTSFPLPFVRITMEDAFLRWAGFSLAETTLAGLAAMEKEARLLGLEPKLEELPESEAVSVLFDLIFVHKVEPSLPKDRPVIILDYPAFVPCLSKNNKVPDGGFKTKERWELYFNGIELANCFTEETDPEEVRRFFMQEGAKKEQNAQIKHQIDHDYWKIFLPGQEISCSGVALGLDRLIMFLTGIN
ncbi:MAG: LysR family transcriptional regulator, partial [Treponema sp.]|nr:LysR family transcriptional regulator [Treponema sp.]